MKIFCSAVLVFLLGLHGTSVQCQSIESIYAANHLFVKRMSIYKGFALVAIANPDIRYSAELLLTTMGFQTFGYQCGTSAENVQTGGSQRVGPLSERGYDPTRIALLFVDRQSWNGCETALKRIQDLNPKLRTYYVDPPAFAYKVRHWHSPFQLILNHGGMEECKWRFFHDFLGLKTQF